MPRFKFKLQRVLEIREHKERLLKSELAELKRLYKQEESILRELQYKHTQYLRRLIELQKEPFIVVEEISFFHAYVDKLHDDCNAQKERLNELSKRIEGVKEKLIEARKERRILEKLRERYWKAFQLEVERVEQNFLDEIGQSIFHRRESSRV
jgi:flagellar FliJ protein